MAAEPLEIEVSEDQQRTRIWRHPDRELIHTLIRAGRTPDWISRWLTQRYPIEDKEGGATPDADRNRRWQLSATTVERYRKTWMPECAPGVDLVASELEDAVGRRLPVAKGAGVNYELDVLEFVIQASQVSLARAVTADKDLEMLQGVTLEAQKGVLDAVKARASLAQSIGLPGYEKAPERIHQTVDQTNRNLNVELHGIRDAHGNVQARDQEKVSLVKALMEMPADEANAIVDRADALVDSIDGTAEDAPDA